MEYVRRLLEEKQAGFAASVELAVSVIRRQIERPEEVVPTVAAALTMVFQSGQAVAVLLTQKLLGAKQF